MRSERCRKEGSAASLVAVSVGCAIWPFPCLDPGSAETPVGPGRMSLSPAARPSGARNLGVIVQPLGADETWHGTRGASVAIFIRDPEICTEVETGLLCELFDLTPAEATVAHRLANGLSLEEAADSLDISRNTVRAHLRSIFSKSGITRQTELVRLMLNSAAVLGARSKSTMQ